MTSSQPAGTSGPHSVVSPRSAALSSFGALAGLLGYRKGLYALNLLTWGLMYTLPILNGLILREFFNHLSGEAPAAASPWTLIAFLVALTVGRAADFYAGFWVWCTLYFQSSALL